MKQPLPTSPDEMPSSFHNDANQVRNCLMSLDNFRSVEMRWEMDIPATNEAGEAVGEWTVEIGVKRATISSRHSSLTNALWFVYILADAADSAEYEEREAKKKSARDKLTPEERKLLGV